MYNGFGVSPLEIMASDAMLQGLIYIEDFTYSARFIAPASQLLANGTTEVQVQINSDSDFVIQVRNILGIQDGDIVADPNILVNLVTAGSGRQLVSQTQHVLNMFGGFQSEHVPGRVAMPKLIQANSTLSVTLTDLSAVDWDRVEVTFEGFKVFYTAAPDGTTANRQSVFHVL
jgi:hypothetical protein